MSKNWILGRRIILSDKNKTHLIFDKS